MSPVAPRKYTDSTRSEITAEWKDWYAREVELASEGMEDTVLGLGEHPQNRWPERYDKSVGDGAWVFVVEEPFTEMRDRFRIPTPSLWWARPEVSRQGAIEVGTKSIPLQIPGLYRVVVNTPGGSLWLYPHEYVVCSDPVPLITDPECTVHPLGGRPPLDEEKQEQMFYLQSRGWTAQDALLALMDGLDMSDWGWVEFPEYARAMFEGVGARPQWVRQGAGAGMLALDA